MIEKLGCCLRLKGEGCTLVNMAYPLPPLLLTVLPLAGHFVRILSLMVVMGLVCGETPLVRCCHKLYWGFALWPHLKLGPYVLDLYLYIPLFLL